MSSGVIQMGRGGAQAGAGRTQVGEGRKDLVLGKVQAHCFFGPEYLTSLFNLNRVIISKTVSKNKL